MSKALLVVDEGKVDGRTTNTVTTFDCWDDAKVAFDHLNQDWAGEGWRKQHECWVKGAEWRQKTIVWQGVEWTEEDGEDE